MFDVSDIGTAMEARFWSKVDVRGEDECWPWMVGHNQDGYGIFHIERRSVHAHRVALALALGGILKEQALHHCDFPPCCNPAHLFEGTNADNVRDRDAKGRGRGALAKSRRAAARGVRVGL